ncbi:hypothetical protein DFH06DRAFT_1479162 [Mycena polygramma]|nr:hypothetical protein DFH06DRAFT_1479162 [Mycena polygramma]
MSSSLPPRSVLSAAQQPRIHCLSPVECSCSSTRSIVVGGILGNLAISHSSSTPGLALKSHLPVYGNESTYGAFPCSHLHDKLVLTLLGRLMVRSGSPAGLPSTFRPSSGAAPVRPVIPSYGALVSMDRCFSCVVCCSSPAFLDWTLEDSDRPAWNALQESLALARVRKISWVNDLRIVLGGLHIPVLLDIENDLTVPRVEDAMKTVKKSMEAWVDHEIHNSARTKDLLTGRLEMDKETGGLIKKSLDFRHYLRVKTADHRRALTRMVLSSHSLAVERRRWKERGKNIVPREWRLCRFCKEEVEDPAHAMFMCKHLPLVVLREAFLTKLYAEIPDIRGQFTDPIGFFRGVLARREITPVLAKLAFDVQKIYDATPMFMIEPPAQ